MPLCVCVCVSVWVCVCVCVSTLLCAPRRQRRHNWTVSKLGAEGPSPEWEEEDQWPEQEQEPESEPLYYPCYIISRRTVLQSESRKMNKALVHKHLPAHFSWSLNILSFAVFQHFQMGIRIVCELLIKAVIKNSILKYKYIYLPFHITNHFKN